MTIKPFGIAREIMEAQSGIATPEVNSVGQLRQWLGDQYPDLNNIASFMIAVNQEYAEDLHPLNPSDEVAIIPPVSGG